MIKSNFNQFKIISNLGNGAHGRVYKVQRMADGKMYALKMISSRYKKASENVNINKKI